LFSTKRSEILALLKKPDGKLAEVRMQLLFGKEKTILIFSAYTLPKIGTGKSS